MSENCESKPAKLGICQMCKKDVYVGDACTISDHLYHEECGSKVTTTKEAKESANANTDQNAVPAPITSSPLQRTFEAPDRLGKLTR